MGNSRFDGLREDLRTAINRHFASHRHGTLLAAIIAAFVARPLIGETRTGDVLVGAMMMLLLLVALYNIDVDESVGERGRLPAQNRRLRVLGWVLAAAAIGSRLPDIFVHSRILNLVVSFCWLMFILFVTVNELLAVLKQREVTGETICAAISVYLMLGYSWAFLYTIMFQLNPESFGGLAAGTPGHPTAPLHMLPILSYFSLTTLSTITFGDITPLTLQARYVAVTEGITGQFYLAILVARLVSLQMSNAASQQVRSRTPDFSTSQSTGEDR